MHCDKLPWVGLVRQGRCKPVRTGTEAIQTSQNWRCGSKRLHLRGPLLACHRLIEFGTPATAAQRSVAERSLRGRIRYRNSGRRTSNRSIGRRARRNRAGPDWRLSGGCSINLHYKFKWTASFPLLSLPLARHSAN